MINLIITNIQMRKDLGLLGPGWPFEWYWNPGFLRVKKACFITENNYQIIYGVNSRTSCGPLFEESGFLRFAESNRNKITRFMYRCYLNDIPGSFLYHFTPVSAVHYHFTRQNDGIFIPAFKTNLGKTWLTFRGPCIWNKILKLKINLDSSKVVFMQTSKHCVKMVS